MQQRALGLRNTLLACVGAVGCSEPPAPSTPHLARLAATTSASTAGAEAPPEAAARGRKLAVGDSHACSIGLDQRLYCWGRNERGQLGDGSHELRNTPVQVPGLGEVRSVAAGGDSTCAIDARGQAWCWGFLTPREVKPSEVKALTEARAIAVASYHACAVVRDGSVRCWGKNDVGQLGNGATKSSTESVLVEGLPGAVDVAVGQELSCALDSSGAVWCWGKNLDRQSPIATRIEGLPAMRSLSLSWSQACGLSRDGEAYCWSDFRPAFEKEREKPTRVPHWDKLRELAVGGTSRTCAVLHDGTASCFELLDRAPRPVVGMSGSVAGRVEALAAGAGSLCGRSENGTVRCAGHNHYGQLGIGEQAVFDTPQSLGRTAVDVMPASMGGCLLDKAGQVECWGFGRWREDADGHAQLPGRVAELEKTSALLKGFRSTEVCATRRSGELWCFQAAHPDQRSKAGPPKLVKGVRNIAAIEPLPSFVAEDAVFARDNSGQLFFVRAPNLAKQAAKPAREVESSRVPGLGKVSGVVQFDRITCVARQAEDVACFVTQVQDGKLSAPALTLVKGVREVTSLAHGTHFCAATKKSSILCWSARVENDKVVISHGPEPQAALAGAALHRGDGLLFVLPDGRTLTDTERGGAAWNGAGVPLYPAPASLAAVDRVRHHSNTCLLRSDGEVACWGSNVGEALGSTQRATSQAALLTKLPPAALAVTP